MITETVVDWNWHGFRRHCYSVIGISRFWSFNWSNVGLGSNLDDRYRFLERLLLGGKRTYKRQEADVARPMSAIGGKADMLAYPSERLSLATRRSCDSVGWERPPYRESTCCFAF